MTAELLRRCGEALYGPHWQSEIARALNVTDRTVRRWVARSSDIPDGVRDDLLAQCRERAGELDDLIAVLSAIETAT